VKINNFLKSGKTGLKKVDKFSSLEMMHFYWVFSVKTQLFKIYNMS